MVNAIILIVRNSVMVSLLQQDEAALSMIGSTKMNTDIKDLLTKAAKNAGYGEITWSSNGHGAYISARKTVWVPHLDDGDSTRLADAMGMNIDYFTGAILIGDDTAQRTYDFTPHNLPELRMAVLRAAAESTKGE